MGRGEGSSGARMEDANPYARLQPPDDPEPEAPPADAADAGGGDAAAAAAAEEDPAAGIIHFAGVFLEPEAQVELLIGVPPLHCEVHSDHYTLRYQPSLEEALALPLGAPVTLRATGVAVNARVQVGALCVRSPATPPARRPYGRGHRASAQLSELLARPLRGLEVRRSRGLTPGWGAGGRGRTPGGLAADDARPVPARDGVDGGGGAGQGGRRGGGRGRLGLRRHVRPARRAPRAARGGRRQAHPFLADSHLPSRAPGPHPAARRRASDGRRTRRGGRGRGRGRPRRTVRGDRVGGAARPRRVGRHVPPHRRRPRPRRGRAQAAGRDPAAPARAAPRQGSPPPPYPAE